MFVGLRDFLWLNLVNILVLGSASGYIVLPVYLELSGMTRWEIGLAWASFSLAAVAIRLKLGGWMVRYGQIPFYRAGALVVALCESFYALIHPTLPVVIMLRVLEGLAVASYFTAVWSRVIDISPPGKLSRYTGTFGISGLFAGAVGPWALEKVAHHWTYPTAFACAGAAGFLGFVLGLRVPEGPRREGGDGPERSFFRVLLSQPMRAVVLTSLMFGVNFGTFNTFIAPYAHSLHLVVGPMFLCYTAASIFVRLLFGGLSDHMHPRSIIVPSLLIFSMAMALLYFLATYPSLAHLILAGALVGLAHGMIYPAISTLAVQRAGASSNTASSVFTACMDLGSLSGATLAGVVSHHRGYPITFAGLCLFLVAGATTVGWLESNAMKAQTGAGGTTIKT